jgi:hypothetical protein
VGVESDAELSPRHLVLCGASGDEVGPPHGGVATKLLCGEGGLLHLYAVQDPKLGLDHLVHGTWYSLVIGLGRLSCLGEERRVSGHEITVGSWSWRGSIPCPLAATSRGGRQLSQQLNLLITGGSMQSLEPRSAAEVGPIWVSGLGITPSIVSVHHSAIQTSHHELRNQNSAIRQT